MPAPPPPAHWRQRLAAWLEQSWVQRLLVALILINAVVLGLETSPTAMTLAGPWLLALDKAILAVFVVEIALRLAAHRLAFFRDPWSVFDLLVVAIALIPASGPLAVLRSLRVLRVLRLLTMVPSMRRVVAGLLSALPGLASVMAIIALLFYVGAVIATKLFAATYPDWFGSLGASAYTLFQVMTLESWSMGIVRPIMETHAQAWLFFIPFIMLSTFTMLNLFIAVIVNAIQTIQHAEPATYSTAPSATPPVPVPPTAAPAEPELALLRTELAEVKALLLAMRPAAATERAL